MKLTPMMRQYLEAREAHPGCIVFFRMGDFYEVFFEDAELVSEALDLTLTARGKGGEDEPIPMAGVPHHSAENHIRRLVALGHHVAICEQLEDAADAKGIVRRGVVRVITPGLLLDEESLDAKSNHFLSALAVSSVATSEVIAIASVDLSTGELRVCEEPKRELVIEELRRIRPSEIVVAGAQADLLGGLAREVDAPLTRRGGEVPRLAAVVERGRGPGIEVDDESRALLSMSTEELRARLSRLDEVAFRDRQAVENALALLLDTIHATQGFIPASLDAPSVYRSEDFVVLDPASTANLELFETLMGGHRKGSLFAVIDRTVTAGGGRRLRTWLSYPLTSIPAIQRRQDAVTTLRERLRDRSALRDALGRCADIQRLCSRLATGLGGPRELARLRDSLAEVPAIRTTLDTFEEGRLAELASQVDPCEDVREAIAAALVDDPPLTLAEGGVIREGYDDALDELLSLAGSAKDWMLRFEAQERAATGISSLKVKFNRVFGYHIEVTRSNLDRVPDHYIRKQTLANAERYFTPELKESEDRILNAEERRITLETELYEVLRRSILTELGRIRETASLLAELDALSGLAELSHERAYHPPALSEDRVLHIREGRHPVVETMVEAGRFVPNDLVMDAETRMIILTGPNMAGKSTVIRQIALITLLAQIGSHVPAAEATIGVVDQIFSRVGASDNLARGQSTFMVEMSETAHILRSASPRSLVILDEIGRGTSTYDGLAIAWSVAEHLHDTIGCFALFATHYHELTELAALRESVANFSIAVREWNDEILFLHQLRPGPANRSYGVQVARLAGVPDAVVTRARAVLDELESAALRGAHTFAEGAGREGGPSATAAPQLSLFAAEPVLPPAAADLLRELHTLEPESLTPLQALNLLASLRERFDASGLAKLLE